VQEAKPKVFFCASHRKIGFVEPWETRIDTPYGSVIPVLCTRLPPNGVWAYVMDKFKVEKGSVGK